MNKKIRLIFETAKKVIFKNIFISVVFFLSFVIVIFFFSRPLIDDDKKSLNPTEENTKLSENDYLTNTQPTESTSLGDIQSSETISSLQKEIINLEKKQINEPKRPVPKNEPALPKISEKTENKKSINLTPSGTIDLLHNTLKKIVSSSFDSKKVERVISHTYNTKRMLTLIIGEVWKNSEVTDQATLKEVFEEYIAKNYILRFKNIKSLEFGKVEISQAGKNYRIAKTKLIINSKDIVALNYLLDQTNNSWKIFDVLIDGSISEIATKKSEFINFTNQGNVKPLVEALREKNSTLLNN